MHDQVARVVCTLLYLATCSMAVPDKQGTTSISYSRNASHCENGTCSMHLIVIVQSARVLLVSCLGHRVCLENIMSGILHESDDRSATTSADLLVSRLC